MNKFFAMVLVLEKRFTIVHTPLVQQTALFSLSLSAQISEYNWYGTALDLLRDKIGYLSDTYNTDMTLNFFEIRSVFGPALCCCNVSCVPD